MIPSRLDRARRLAAAASALTVIAVVISVLVLAIKGGIPQSWWPRTGQAFAADTHPTNQDPCDLIVGPARDYCERGTTATAPAPEQPDITGAAWRLVPACAGLAVLVVWRFRSGAGRGRR